MITFGVTAVNDAPVANDDNGGSIIEDGANGIVDILTNDTDVEGNPTAPTNGPGQFTVDMDLATAGVQATITTAQGVWTYNPAIGLVVFDPTEAKTHRIGIRPLWPLRCRRTLRRCAHHVHGDRVERCARGQR